MIPEENTFCPNIIIKMQNIDKHGNVLFLDQERLDRKELGFPTYKNRSNDLMDHMLEICFCCPCCCITMKLARNATDKERHRFHPSGWTAVADLTKCVACKTCMNGQNGCPVEALSFGEDGTIRIDQEKCLGCGICSSRCPHDVIHIKQTMPMRKDIHEYFLKDYSLDIKLGDKVHEE